MRIASMKSTRGRKAISILLSVVMVLAALPLTALPAAALTSGDFKYKVLSGTDKTCEITDYTGSATALAIPSKLYRYTVTSIGEGAFNGCASLTSVTIPNSVTSIGPQAFRDCTALKSITIPNSVTSIGYEAFSGCTALASVTIPNSVTSVDREAFFGCTSLASITIPDSVTSIGDWAFLGCALTSVTLPNSVTKIYNYTFYDCTALTSIAIPNSVTSISDYAFYGCTALTSVIIPNSVTSIGEEAFAGCTALTDITIPDSVTSIGAYAFLCCTALESISIPNSVTSIGEEAFYGCTALTSITIPDSVTSIGYGAFYDSGLTTIYGYTGSYAETFASADGYTFVALQKLTDAESGVSVLEGNFGNFAENTVLNVEILSAEENKITYDITLTVNGEAVQPASAVTVKIPVPETMYVAQCKVYRQEADGTYTDMQATYQNGYMVFTTDHFSTYVLTTADPNAPTYTLGDVNGDDKINAVDARWVLQAASGARTFDATQTAAADVNGDGKVNAVDARWILQVASGARTL